MQSLAISKIDAYAGMKEYRRAIDACLDLLDEYHKNNDPQGSVTILEKMADVYKASGDKDKAADSYNTIASIHANFNHLSIAESYREKAAELSGDGA